MLRIEQARVIIWIEAVLLAALAPLFIFPSMDRVWPFLVFPVLWIVRWWIEKKWKTDQGVMHFSGTPLDAAIFLLAVQLFISSVSAGAWAAMLPKIAGLLYGILVFYTLTQLMRADRLIAVGIGIYIAGGVALAVIGLSGMFFVPEPHFQKILRFFSDIIPRKAWAFTGAELGLNPNAVAGVMTLFVPLCLVFALSWAKKRNEGILLALFFSLFSLFFLFALFLTQAIAAWAALAIGLWLVLPARKTKIMIALFAALAMAAAIVFMQTTDMKKIANLEKPFLKKKIEDRHLRWFVGIDAVMEKPLTGVGINMLRWRPELGYERSHAHNHMLHTAAELGIPGLIAYIAILGGVWGMSRSIWHRPGPAWMRESARGLAAGQAAHFIFGLGDSIPLGAKPGIFFWVSLALISALFKRPDKSPNLPELGSSEASQGPPFPKA